MEQHKRRRTNNYIDCDDYCKIEIRDKYNIVQCYALIDKEDKEKCQKLQWHLVKSKNNINYIAAHYYNENQKDVKIQLHRYVLNYNGEKCIDHINRNGLDNRKENLRIVNTSINNLNKNTSGIKKVGNLYQSKFQAYGKVFCLGYYLTKEEASFVANKCKDKYINNKEEFIRDYNLIKLIDSIPNPNRNIIITPKGNYAVKYLYKKRAVYIGTFYSVEEARKARDDFEKQRDSYKNGKNEFYESFLAMKNIKNKYNGIQKVPSGKWRLNFNINGKPKYIGTYDTKEEAAEVRKKLLEDKKHIA